MGRIWMPGGGGGADLSRVTATSPDVLIGKIIVDANGKPITGTMPDNGAVSQTLNAGDSYSIPRGYHNGNGRVTGSSLAEQTAATATAAKVLVGETYYANGVKGTGTMQDNGAVSQTLNAGDNYPIPRGYHNGNGKVTANSLAGQTAATATGVKVLLGETYYANGVKGTGTMPNRGAVSQTLGINGTYTIPEGYHNGQGTVKQQLTTKGAATYTPSTSPQEVPANVYLTGKQIIAAIDPTKWSDITKDQVVFHNGVFGVVVNQGWRGGYGQVSTEYTSYLYFGDANPTTPVIEGSEIKLSCTYARPTCGILFNGSIDLTPYTKISIVVRVPAVPASGASFQIGVVATDISYHTDSSRTVTGLARTYRDISSAATLTIDCDISNINRHAFIASHFGCGSSAGASAYIQSITLVK